MQPDKSAHIAAPESFEHNGERYLLSPLELLDLKELEKYLRWLPIEQIRPQLAGLPDAWVRTLLRKAYGRGAKIRLGTRAFAAESQSFEGLTYMLWLSLRKARPQLKLSDVIPILSANIDELTRKVNLAAGYEDSENPTGAAAVAGEDNAAAAKKTPVKKKRTPPSTSPSTSAASTGT